VQGANIYFQTNPGPGWSKGDNLDDPRKLPSGPGAVPWRIAVIGRGSVVVFMVAPGGWRGCCIP